MLRFVSGNTIGECWINSIKIVLENGDVSHDEDVTIQEILGLSIEIESPSGQDQIIEHYGDPFVIEKMIKKFSKGVVMNDRSFTYGQLIFDKEGIDQFEWLISRIEKKQETKSATISLLSAGLNHPNLPCLSTIDVKIRNDKLNLQFFFRSQNIFGRQYANLIALSRLHQKLAERLGYEVGIMSGYIASAHIYEYDFDMAEQLVKGCEVSIKDQYYIKGPMSVRAR